VNQRIPLKKRGHFSKSSKATHRKKRHKKKQKGRESKKARQKGEIGVGKKLPFSQGESAGIARKTEKEQEPKKQ